MLISSCRSPRIEEKAVMEARIGRLTLPGMSRDM
jgi:hypothetical protein